MPNQLMDLMFSQIFVEAPRPTVLGSQGPYKSVPNRIDAGSFATRCLTCVSVEGCPARHRDAGTWPALKMPRKCRGSDPSSSVVAGRKPVGERTWLRGALFCPTDAPASRGNRTHAGKSTRRHSRLGSHRDSYSVDLLTVEIQCHGACA
jgi:hypothetical protein